MHNKTTLKPSPLSKLKIFGLIVVGIVLIMCGFFFFNPTVKAWAHRNYYYAFIFDHFSNGDKIYITKDFFGTGDATAIPYYKLIRPMTDEEINSRIFLGEDQKKKFKLLNRIAPSYLVRSNIFVNKDSLIKYKTTFIGTYIKKDILSMIDRGNKSSLIAGYLYAVRPNEKTLYRNENPWPTFDKIPDNYMLANDTLYLIPFGLSNKSTQ